VSGPEVPLRIAVVGAGEAEGPELELAEAVGRAIGAAGAVLICGGRGGVMASAARGCLEAGGWTVGLLPDSGAEQANPWIRLPLPTGLGEARNALVVRTAEAVVAVGGRWGTLSEIALAAKVGTPVCLLGTPPADGLDLPRFENAEKAVRWALTGARSGRRP
jgi:uncharacterized protein (TIGR00725 family)